MHNASITNGCHKKDDHNGLFDDVHPFLFSFFLTPQDFVWKIDNRF